MTTNVAVVPSALVEPCSVFIDFQDFLCNTDFYVVKKIFTQTRDTLSKYHYRYLHYIYDEFIDEDDEYIIDRINLIKSSDNILMDFLDKDEIKPCDYNTVLKNLYYIYLYKDAKDFISNAPWTSIASSLKLLLKDKNLINLTIFIGDKHNLNPTIHRAIYNFFDDDKKIDLVCGPEEVFLRTNPYNIYFLKHCAMLEPLCCSRPNMIDVFVLGYEYNLNQVDDARKIVRVPNNYTTINHKIELKTITLPI